MKRLLKGISALLSLLLLTAITAVVLVTTVLDPNQFKPLIISQFKQLTGFEMQIPGQLSWSFYPTLGVEASAVSIQDAPVFNAQLKHVVLRLKFAPLLRKQVEITRASIDELQLNNVQLTEVQAKLEFKDQLLAIEHLKATLYQGTLKGDITVSLKQPQPVLRLKGELKKVQIASLLKGLSGQESSLHFEGLANLSWDLKTEGKETKVLLSQLEGRGAFKIGQGVLKGVDLGFFVETAAALINKKPLPTPRASAQTTFGQISGTALVKEGIMTVNDLVLESPLYVAQGAGTIDLLSQTLNYHVKVLATGALKINNKPLALYGQSVPLQISGKLRNPQVSLDTLALMQTLGKEQLQRVGQEIQKALPEKANAFIKSLFH